MELPDFLITPKQLVNDKDLQHLDCKVWGVIYWYTKLKLQKCILSNSAFSQLLSVEPRSIQRSLARLSQKNYIKIFYKDELHKQRDEIIPTISFGGTTDRSYLYDPTVVGVRPNGHHNNIDIKREINNTHNLAADAAGNGKDINQLLELFKGINPNYEHFYRNKTERKALEELIIKFSLAKMQNLLRMLPDIVNKPYAPRITSPLSLQRKMGDLIIFLNQEKKKGGGTIDARHIK